MPISSMHTSVDGSASLVLSESRFLFKVNNGASWSCE